MGTQHGKLLDVDLSSGNVSVRVLSQLVGASDLFLAHERSAVGARYNIGEMGFHVVDEQKQGGTLVCMLAHPLADHLIGLSGAEVMIEPHQHGGKAESFAEMFKREPG